MKWSEDTEQGVGPANAHGSFKPVMSLRSFWGSVPIFRRRSTTEFAITIERLHEILGQSLEVVEEDHKMILTTKNVTVMWSQYLTDTEGRYRAKEWYEDTRVFHLAGEAYEQLHGRRSAARGGKNLVKGGLTRGGWCRRLKTTFGYWEPP
ncbi:hypothetical protein TWF506_002927 [Arthrobotrys conoides]|uniref:Uncharacterized protein n=1 Tax=Arthrobotrys conoides TaxID=74498 RepID=A0AAN8RQV1_9PEZI